MRAWQRTSTGVRTWCGLIILALGVTGGGVARHMADAQAQAARTALPVSVEATTPTAITECCETVGTIRSRTTTVLSSKVMGYVCEVLVREGGRVKAGQLLIQLDNRDLAAQARRAQAGLEEAQSALDEVENGIAAAEASKMAADANGHFAQATLQRYQEMFDQQAVSRQEFDAVVAKARAARADQTRAEATIKSLQAKKHQVLAKIAQAKAEVTSAQVYLGYASIHSPMDGVVLDKRVEAGSLAMPGVPLLSIEDPRRYRLEAQVPESQIRKIVLGMTVPVTVEATGEQSLTGTVGEIVPAADPSSRTFVVKVDLPQTTELRSGMYGKAYFPVGEHQAILLPRSALLEQGQLQTIYIVEPGNVARLRLVKTGKTYGDHVEILSGVKAGDRVVVQGAERLFDGVPVEVKAR